LADIFGTDGVNIFGPSIPQGIEVSGVPRVWIRTADKFKLNDEMGGDHTRIRWMELIVESERFKFLTKLMDLLSDDQAWAVSFLGQEIPHGSTDRTRHSDRFAFGNTNCKLSIDLGNLVAIPAEHPRFGFLKAHIQENITLGVHKVFDSRNVLMVCHRLDFFEGEVKIDDQWKSPISNIHQNQLR
jgi:hypothetical protein